MLGAGYDDALEFVGELDGWRHHGTGKRPFCAFAPLPMPVHESFVRNQIGHSSVVHSDHEPVYTTSVCVCPSFDIASGQVQFTAPLNFEPIPELRLVKTPPALTSLRAIFQYLPRQFELPAGVSSALSQVVRNWRNSSRALVLNAS
jgi:hypothetical protein